MKWIHREPVKGAKNEELRLGVASWDDGSCTAKSIKYTWFDKTGRAARGGELPVEALPQMIAFAKRHKFL
jgi:hypothetical protein